MLIVLEIERSLFFNSRKTAIFPELNQPSILLLLINIEYWSDDLEGILIVAIPFFKTDENFFDKLKLLIETLLTSISDLR